MRNRIDTRCRSQLKRFVEGEAPFMHRRKEESGRRLACIGVFCMLQLATAALCVGLFIATILSGLATKIDAQSSHPADSSRMQQLHKAISLAEHGDSQAAMQIALHLLEQDPNFEPALTLKGTLLEQGGSPAEAQAAYEAALKLNPNDADLLLKTGIYKLQAGQREEALQALRRAAKLLPVSGEVQYYLAQAYHLNNRDDLALQAVRKSLNADPQNASVQQKYGELLSSTGNNQDSLHWLLQAQHTDATLPRIDYEIGAADYKLMDLSAAEKNLERAVKSSPGDMNALQMLASTQSKLAEWEAAKQSYARLIVGKPDDADTLLGLGQCELELKDYTTAAGTLQSALRIDPTKLLAHFYLSRAYAAMGRTEDAQHEAALHHLMMEQMSFVRSVETEQREEAIRHQARPLLRERREEDALRLYREHFKATSTTDADAFVFVGKIYLFMGNTEDGVRCLDHALAIDPRVRGAHTYQGILALKMGDLAKAEDAFKAELANDPSYQMAIAEMGEVRYHQENWTEAADWLVKSKTMTPELLYMLSDADFHLGKMQDADLVAETAAAYGRNNSGFMRGLVALLARNGQAGLAHQLVSASQP
jgi:tetratricopeptide (TPR) repeat protein